MTTLEKFQAFQVELVRAGFATELRAQPNGEGAVLTMSVELHNLQAEDLERLDALTLAHGFSYAVAENSRAAITLGS